ncbi:MAG: PAS domain S-box protein, partial [Euryarchaeota archaeon]|nr:PAS domain S-box protein [Euryarchaeota archaeon]
MDREERPGDYETFLESVDRHLREAVIRVDPDGVITWWGRGAERLFGYTREEALGRSIDIIIPERFRGEHERVLAQVREEGSLRRHMTLRVARDGTEVPIKMAAGAIERDGELVGLSLVLQDISEEKEAIRAVVEAEREYLSLFESSMDIIFSLDGEGRFTSINAAFERTTGLDRREFIGKSFLDLAAPWYREAVRDALKEVSGGRDVSLELLVVARDIAPKVISFNLFPNKGEGGRIEGAWGIGRDVTEKKLAEEKLRNYARELEEANRLKDLFIDIIRHDLVNPIGTINN